MEKIDPSLNLALWLAENNMVQNESLQYGYDAEKKLWTVIVKHIGEIRYIEDAFPGTRVVELFNQYAIITTSAQNLLLKSMLSTDIVKPLSEETPPPHY